MIRRNAFTLTELLFVIVILVTLATLTALYFPRFREQQSIHRGADLLSQWVLEARQQALRDGVPTGLRLITTDGRTSNLQLIQQPGDPARGHYVGRWAETATEGQRAFFQLPRRFPDFVEDKLSTGFGVQPGDYLSLDGINHRIAKVDDVSVTLVKGSSTTRGPDLPTTGDPRQGTTPYIVPGKWIPDPNHIPDPMNPTAPVPLVILLQEDKTGNYQFVLSPKPAPFEPDRTLPEGVGIDVGMSRGLSVTNGNREILFSPRGDLIGGGTNNQQVILWVRNVTESTTDKGVPLLVTIQPRTGFIAVHPVAEGPDPYLFTKDARSSGM